MSECKACGASLDWREAFCSKCGELTSMGKSPSDHFSQTMRDMVAGLGSALERASDYVRDPANRRVVVAGSIGLAVLLLAFSDNPLTRGVGTLFEDTPDEPQLTENGLPDLASYEDVFLGMKERDHLEEYLQICRRTYERHIREGTWPWPVDSTDSQDVIDSESNNENI